MAFITGTNVAVWTFVVCAWTYQAVVGVSFLLRESGRCHLLISLYVTINRSVAGACKRNLLILEKIFSIKRR